MFDLQKSTCHAKVYFKIYDLVRKMHSLSQCIQKKNNSDLKTNVNEESVEDLCQKSQHAE
jgi:hypothetical protein